MQGGWGVRYLNIIRPRLRLDASKERLDGKEGSVINIPLLLLHILQCRQVVSLTALGALDGGVT